MDDNIYTLQHTGDEIDRKLDLIDGDAEQHVIIKAKKISIQYPQDSEALQLATKDYVDTNSIENPENFYKLLHKLLPIFDDRYILTEGAKLAFALNEDKASYSVIGIGDCTTTDIVIPATYSGLPVTSIFKGAFEGYDNLTSVTIPDSVTSIGRSAFADCESLTSVTINGGSIGGNAFSGCDSLTSVTINSGSIGDYAFSACTSLTNVTIGNGVTNIGESAFANCSSLTKVTIGNGVTGIEDKAFYQCFSLESVTIGNGVTSIGDNAFFSCRDLTSITIPDSVISIGSSAFAACNSLTSITIPNSVTSIGSFTFNGCYSLTSVTIGNSVKSIGSYAFYSCSGLTNVTIGNGVTSIAGFAFYKCSSLTSITIPNSVTFIGGETFSDCTTLASIYIRKSEGDIGGAPWGADNAIIYWLGQASVGLNYALNNDNLSYSVIGIGTCTDTSIIIPSKYGDKPVTSLGIEAFRNCSSFTSITIPDSVESIGSYAFESCSGLTKVTIGNGVTNIGNSAFVGCTNLRYIYIDKSEGDIGGAPWGANDTTVIQWEVDKVDGSPKQLAEITITALDIDEYKNSWPRIYYTAWEDSQAISKETIVDPTKDTSINNVPINSNILYYWKRNSELDWDTHSGLDCNIEAGADLIKEHNHMTGLMEHEFKITSNYATFYLSFDCCFKGDSQVLMSDMTTKKISDLTPGDSVMTYNASRDILEANEIVDTKVAQILRNTEVVLENGTVINMNGYHPLWTKEGWKSITRYRNLPILTEKDQLLTSDGTYLAIKSITSTEIKLETYYTLTVANNNNFYVNGILAQGNDPE